MCGGEGLVIDQYAEKELSGWGDVLKEAERGEWYAFGGLAEEEQGDGCDGTCTKQEDVDEGVEVAEGTLTVSTEDGDIDGGSGHHPDGFDGECCSGIECHFLFDESVDGKGGGE